MIKVSIDTCVWLELLRSDPHTLDNAFEEFCFWIENKHILHIVPQNVLREWDRNKMQKLKEIVGQIDKVNTVILSPFRANDELKEIYSADKISDIISKRIDRIEKILKFHSEIVEEPDEVLKEAGLRNPVRADVLRTEACPFTQMFYELGFAHE